MASGLLEVAGVIDPGQFWPAGTADADTTKITVDVEAGAFTFRAHPGAPSQVTRAFDNATVVGHTTRKAAIDKGRIVVRLQGIDAPELHYRPQSAITVKQGRTKAQTKAYLALNEDYRQHLGETATVNLTRFLRQAGQNPLSCVVSSAVDEPDEVFDTYGRFVGDIALAIGGQKESLNTWLLRAGWAFPAFYNSMSKDEITALTDVANEAWSGDRGVWPLQNDYAKDFDWKLVFRRPSKNPAVDAQADRGPVLFPKLFRRLSTWAVNKKAGMVTGTFHAYLKKNKDELFVADDFIAQGPAAQTRTLDEFVDSDGFFSLWPEQAVFKEKPSTLLGPGGTPVTW